VQPSGVYCFVILDIENHSAWQAQVCIAGSAFHSCLGAQQGVCLGSGLVT